MLWCWHILLLTNEMTAAKISIFTKRSSNCSRINTQRALPSSAGNSESEKG